MLCPFYAPHQLTCSLICGRNGSSDSVSVSESKELKSGFSVRFGEGDWMTSSFLKKFCKIEKSFRHIDIKDNKIGFGFFWIDNDFDFYELKDFFRKKNKENEKKFLEYMIEKYDYIKNDRYKYGESLIECEVPDGKLNFYNLVASRNIPNSEIEKGDFLADVIKI